MSQSAPPPRPLDEAPFHLLIVDDDRRIRDLLIRYLQRNGFRVSAAESAARARGKMRGVRFDLIILDLMMPGESGLELARSLGADAPPILMLTARTDTPDRISGLEAGAEDYLVKPFEPRELLLRIGNILTRREGERERLHPLRMGACVFDLQGGRLTRDGAPVNLSFREMETLKMFARAPGRIFTRAEIAARHGAGSERAVDVRINRLRRKIEPSPDEPLYLRTVRGAGYMLQPD